MYGESDWISIPSTEALGNHSFTAPATFQIYDNETSEWITPNDSPKSLNGTLLVLPAPAASAFTNLLVGTMLPISAILLVSGGVAASNLLKRRRSPNPLAETRRGGTGQWLRPRLPPLLVAGTSIVSAGFIWYLSQINLYSYPSLAWSEVSWFALLLPTMDATAAIFKRRHHLLSLLSILLFSLSATLASTILIRTYA